MPALFSSGYGVKVPSWHRLENLLNEAPKTVKDSLAEAGQDWTLTSENVYDGNGNIVPLGKLFRRSDNNQILSIVGPKTYPLQNVDAFAFLQEFIDKGELTLETAGCLDEGRKVWTLAQINRPNFTVVKGDEIRKYLLISNSHDGTLSVHLGMTPIRVVCYNTLSAAIFSKEAKKQMVKIRHSKQVKERFDDATATINAIDDEMNRSFEGFAALANVGIKEKDAREYFKQVFKMKPDDEMPKQSITTLENLLALHDENISLIGELLGNHKKTEEITKAADEIVGKAILETMLENMENGIGTENEPSRGSWWTAYNAVTQYLTHDRGRTDETRLASLWYGDSSVKNAEALELALEMAGISRNKR